MTSFIGMPSNGSRYWRDSVATVGDLPASATDGEIRYVQSEDKLYAFNGTTWAVAGNNIIISEDPPSGPGDEGDIWIQV